MSDISYNLVFNCFDFKQFLGLGVLFKSVMRFLPGVNISLLFVSNAELFFSTNFQIVGDYYTYSIAKVFD